MVSGFCFLKSIIQCSVSSSCPIPCMHAAVWSAKTNFQNVLIDDVDGRHATSAPTSTTKVRGPISGVFLHACCAQSKVSGGRKMKTRVANQVRVNFRKFTERICMEISRRWKCETLHHFAEHNGQVWEHGHFSKSKVRHPDTSISHKIQLFCALMSCKQRSIAGCSKYFTAHLEIVKEILFRKSRLGKAVTGADASP